MLTGSDCIAYSRADSITLGRANRGSYTVANFISYIVTNSFTDVGTNSVSQLDSDIATNGIPVSISIVGTDAVTDCCAVFVAICGAHGSANTRPNRSSIVSSDSAAHRQPHNILLTRSSKRARLLLL